MSKIKLTTQEKNGVAYKHIKFLNETAQAACQILKTDDLAIGVLKLHIKALKGDVSDDEKKDRLRSMLDLLELLSDRNKNHIEDFSGIVKTSEEVLEWFENAVKDEGIAGLGESGEDGDEEDEHEVPAGLLEEMESLGIPKEVRDEVIEAVREHGIDAIAGIEIHKVTRKAKK